MKPVYYPNSPPELRILLYGGHLVGLRPAMGAERGEFPHNDVDRVFFEMMEDMSGEDQMKTLIKIDEAHQQSYLSELDAAEQEQVLQTIEDYVISTLLGAPGRQLRASTLRRTVADTLLTPEDNVRIALSRLVDRGLIDPDIGPYVTYKAAD